ncbi:hypothetical protein D3C79_885760 [compost metagenome]
MRNLPPLVKGFDGPTVEWQRLEDVNFEFLGYLLSCHLVIEHYLDEVIMTLGTSLNWESAKLTFSQKLALFPQELLPGNFNPIPAIKHLNSIRNKIALNIRSRPEDLNLLPIKDYLSANYRDAMDVPSGAIELLEEFTSIVCSCFAGWIASDAHRTTWRNKK